MIKVIIADDHRIFREGIVALLADEKNIEVIAESNNGQELMNLLKGLKPNVVLMDIEMPIMNGIDCTREIVAKYPSIKIIALSMHIQSAFIKQMLKAGVHGYLQKDIGKKELVKAIETVMKTGSYFGDKIGNLVLLSLRESEKSHELTPREKEIIQLIVNQNTTDEIANILHISKYTVESHRQNILLKLDLRNTAGLVKYAIENAIVVEK
ncbi:response regulator transcription factor [Flavobacteriaceae bacterium GF1]